MEPLHQRLSTLLATIARRCGLAFVLNTDANTVPYINPLQGEDLNQAVRDALNK
jgi:hypothetical protein